jgi:hypothetical protein
MLTYDKISISVGCEKVSLHTIYKVRKTVTQQHVHNTFDLYFAGNQEHLIDNVWKNKVTRQAECC